MKEMKNENVHMQALYRKLDVVLVQILRYNCLETVTAFARIRHPAGLRPLPRCGFHPQTPWAPTIFFAPPPLQPTGLQSWQKVLKPLHKTAQQLVWPIVYIERAFLILFSLHCVV